MAKLRQFLGGLLCALGGWLLTACSSEEDSLQIPEGKGYVKLSLHSETGFLTKASESKEVYKNLDNYTVQILQDGTIVDNHEYIYSQMPNFVELATGTYNFKAFCGEDQAVYAGKDTLNLYFSDEETFSVEGDTASVNLTCEPNSARINVVFSETMDDYFDNYQVIISTEAQKGSVYPWTRDTKGPVYFKVNSKENVGIKVELTPKQGTTAKPVETSYELSPKDAKTITIEPVSKNGNLGIKIEINKQVIEHPIDIEIPSDWVE